MCVRAINLTGWTSPSDPECKVGKVGECRPCGKNRPLIMKTAASYSTGAAAFRNFSKSYALKTLRCHECNIQFVRKGSLIRHLTKLHVKQPIVILNPIKLPPLKLTLKSTSNKEFEIVPSTRTEPFGSSDNVEQQNNLAEEEVVSDDKNDSELAEKTAEPSCVEKNDKVVDDQREESQVEEECIASNKENNNEEIVEECHLDCSEVTTETMIETKEIADKQEEFVLIENTDVSAEVEIHDITDTIDDQDVVAVSESTTAPKIRIKTTGLLRESSPPADKKPAEKKSEEKAVALNSRDFLSLINNNQRAKDFGLTTSDSDFFPSEDFNTSSNNNTMQFFNNANEPPTNALKSLANLPMDALAQQVSRLQPQTGGMHQQNVLINIQQFPQTPPHHAYQPPPQHQIFLPQPPPPPQQMYHHHQPQYHPPYQPQPPPPRPPPQLYYPPPGHAYVPMQAPPPPPPPAQMPRFMRPPPPPLNPLQQNMYKQIRPKNVPSTSAPARMVPPNAPKMATPSAPPLLQVNAKRGRPPKTVQQSSKDSQTSAMRPQTMPLNAGMKQSNGVMGARPMPRPAGNDQVAMQQQQIQQQQRMARKQMLAKREHEMKLQQQVRRKKMDLLTPDKDDDDCQVICMQPNDGNLPQIQSVEGGTEDLDNNVMHLSDSITLSVRNNPQRTQSPKTSEANQVANILATRGITVTSGPKGKAQIERVKTPPSPVSINLNDAVSLIPATSSKGPATTITKIPMENASKSKVEMPTVDLTDDTTTLSSSEPPPKKVALSSSMATPSASRSVNVPKPKRMLPFKCDLCPNQYSSGLSLSKHRQTYHKTARGMCEFGVPLINLKHSGIFRKLGAIGIFNYIPLPQAGTNGCFALPIINAQNANAADKLGSTTMLTLGPVRSIPRLNPSGTIKKQINNKNGN